MEKTLKTKEIISTYKVLENARYQKLSDDEKVKVWKVLRVLKPFYVQYSEDYETAMSSFMSEETRELMPKAIDYERKLKAGDNANLPMTSSEYAEYAKEFIKGQKLVTKALTELLDKEVTLTLDSLSEDCLGNLLASNDWKLADIEKLEWLME